MNGLLQVLGINGVPPGETEASLIRKIALDNLFYSKALEFLIIKNAPFIAQTLHPLEIAALKKRLAIPEVAVPSPAAQPNGVRWSFVSRVFSLSGRAQIVVTRGAESYTFSSRPDKAEKLEIFGQKVPSHILDQYKREFSWDKELPETTPGYWPQQPPDTSHLPGPNYEPREENMERKKR